LRLGDWYDTHGRHDLAWRASRDRWAVLVSEVMLQQTQVTRVAPVWPGFLARFPTPEAMAAAAPADVLVAWGRLGYPRRARRLWEAAVDVAAHGWPDDLADLPGIGRYTADAVAAQVDGADVIPVETNVRRVLERRAGRRLRPGDAGAVAREAGGPGLSGRDRFLALMDVGAVLCRPRAPRCGECPLSRSCVTAADPHRPDPSIRRPQARFEGSFRQRRGQVMAALRSGPQPAATLDPEVLASLVADGLAAVDDGTATLPS
jgi:A/G-specific adenine glycosylase